MLMCQINNENIKYLRTIIETTSNIVSGPRTFRFTQEGLSFESMDQGSVFVYFKVLKEFFTTYELKNDVLELRLNIDDLKKVLSRAISSDEILTLVSPLVKVKNENMSWPFITLMTMKKKEILVRLLRVSL